MFASLYNPNHKKYTKSPNLQTWLSKERKRIADNDSSLSQDQCQRLTNLGIGGYNQIFGQRWDHNFDLLPQYYSEHGHCKSMSSKMAKVQRLSFSLKLPINCIFYDSFSVMRSPTSFDFESRKGTKSLVVQTT